MRSMLPLEFPHRMNADGTINSICPHCYATVATSTWEAELERAELEHTCERSRLRSFGTTHRPPFRQTWIPPEKLNKTA